MAFTYGYDLSDATNRVRFEIGDTDSDAHFLEDEEIAALLSLHDDDWQLAVLASIQTIIARLARPTFQADWLRVDNKTAIEAYRRLLSDKRQEYGVDEGGSIGLESSGVDVYRSDVTDPYLPDLDFPD